VVCRKYEEKKRGEIQRVNVTEKRVDVTEERVDVTEERVDVTEERERERRKEGRNRRAFEKEVERGWSEVAKKSRCMLL
jgi:hypothetical protein